MKNILKFALGMAGVVSLSSVAQATVLLDHKADTVTANAETQIGRIGRSTASSPHNQQSWARIAAGQVTYPGAVNTTASGTPVTYHYVTYTFTAAQLGNGKYVEINFSEPNVNNLFVSAWTVFNGTSSVESGTGWLGDAAQSENYFGATDARYFDVTVPSGADLIVVVNTTASPDTAGIGEPYGIQVNAYSDRKYTDATGGSAPVAPGGKGQPVSEVALIGGAISLVRRRQTKG